MNDLPLLIGALCIDTYPVPGYDHERKGTFLHPYHGRHLPIIAAIACAHHLLRPGAHAVLQYCQHGDSQWVNAYPMDRATASMHNHVWTSDATLAETSQALLGTPRF